MVSLADVSKSAEGTFNQEAFGLAIFIGDGMSLSMGLVG
jgi:hypothetical protein